MSSGHPDRWVIHCPGKNLGSYVKSVSPIEDDYALRCADVTGDGKINVIDVSRVYAHIKQTNPIW